MSFGKIQARLFASPQIDHRLPAQALLDHLVTSYGRSTIVLEHPRDDMTVSDLLAERQFKIQREHWHMRLDL